MRRAVFTIIIALLTWLLPQSHSRAQDKTDPLAALNRAKTNLANTDRAARAEWAKAIDDDIKSAVQRAGANQAIQYAQKLKQFRTFGTSYGDVPDDDLVLNLSIQYYNRIAVARWTLYQEYEKVNRRILDGKLKIVNENQIAQETLQFLKETEEIDKIKIGNTFRGFRHDPMRNMNMPIELKITERLGHEFKGRVSLNDGLGIFNVVGTVAGLQVTMKKLGPMEKGGERYFEYAGYIVGERILIKHQGVTAGRKITEGWSWMKKK